MKPQHDDPSTRITQEWQPAYWQTDPHSSSWAQVKEALQRDWEQTKKDFHAGGQELNQQVSNTVKQATGNETIPAPGDANPVVTESPWTEAEQAVRYGYGAHVQYGSKFEKWNDALEVKLSSEWDETETGKPFTAVRPFVRHGWNAKS